MGAAAYEQQAQTEHADSLFERALESLDQPFEPDWRLEKYKKPALAAWLSMVPGLGQIYLGKPGMALAAIALTGGFTWLSINSLSLNLYTVFAFTALPYNLSTYLGNIRYAQSEAQSINEESPNQRCPHRKLFATTQVIQYLLRD